MTEEGACVASSFQPGERRLELGISSPLARNKINLTLLAYVAGDAALDSVTVLCTDLPAGSETYSLVNAGNRKGAVRLHSGACILSLYPHDKRSEIKGNFILSLAQARVKIRGLASSPSAIAAVLSRNAKDRAIQALFQHFQFPSYQTPEEFHAVRQPPQEVVREVIASYQEKVIRVYHIIRQEDLDLWELLVPSSGTLEAFAEALIVLGAKGLKIPFLVAVPGPEKKFLLSFAITREVTEEVERILEERIPALVTRRHSPVAVVFLHGPHFGDRYGIADTLIQALAGAGVSLLGLSCCVSSITVVVKQAELPGALQVLGDTFEDQSKCR